MSLTSRIAFLLCSTLSANGSVGKQVALISSAFQTPSDQDFQDPTPKAQVPNPQINDPTCNHGALLAPDKRPGVRGGGAGVGVGLTLALGSQTGGPTAHENRAGGFRGIPS